MNAVTFLYATAPNEEIARRLVENGDAACVNMIPAMKSVYRWKGGVEIAGEIVLIVKTTTILCERARMTILAAHPYEIPAIAAISIDESHSLKAYCDWIRNPD